MNIKITKFINKLKKGYNLFYYSSPLPVLSNGESLIFHLINLIILFISIYYTIFYIPKLLIHSMEKIVYYLTGQHIYIFGLLQTGLKLVNHATHNNNVTTFSSSIGSLTNNHF
ncbi:conserved hypothetical protein [Candida dubliniensis CD36]|uniref:Uncharacterized protein n=1 Tax=Candida dubliniensis (strain CD36 / ATCC MYA-646 / CBS 7987 / NCPF 3949 / NRRL Y-17841) TaxID=573826 RepID=B9WIL0_CANDC|nr:conserved hypothetical protein [Candida dubliniensis CD36]CAX41075.1 conserved hypothetical protein [Candida dubliniensis CD36]